MPESIASPRGTRDILPNEVNAWQLMERVARDVFDCFGYREIRTPIFESTDLFTRGIGAETDIVFKEMYVFSDRSGRTLSLRPEGTAGVVRAFLDHNLKASPLSPLKLWYQGPMFRYERPQKGRQRQFHQIGVEVLGSDAPAADAEAIVLACEFFRRLNANWSTQKSGDPKANAFRVEVNTLGDQRCRPPWREHLQSYCRAHRDEYCADCVRRMETNPLRVLDCKVPSCRDLNSGAPTMALCPPCSAHFHSVVELLDSVGLPVFHNVNLVRGLDYYNRTVFEVVPIGPGFQSILCAGGRYDRLVEDLGGSPTPAVGWALGQERVLDWLRDSAAAENDDPPLGAGDFVPELFVGSLCDDATKVAFRFAGEVRSLDIGVHCAFAPAKPDKHLKQATRIGSRFLALIGPDELKRQEVTVRDLNSRTQASIALDKDQLFAHLASVRQRDQVPQ